MAGTETNHAAGKGGKLSQRVYASLLASLESGQLPPDGRLPPETELARRYHVSRPTIRKVLGQLRDERRIVSRQGSGSYATRAARKPELDLPLNDTSSCLYFRRAVEPACVALAAEHHSDESFAELTETVRRQEAAMSARNLEAFIEADLAFHLVLARISGNSYLDASMQSIREPLEAMIRACARKRVAESERWNPQVLREHKEILLAIRQGSSMLAVEAMNQHLGYARQKLCSPR